MGAAELNHLFAVVRIWFALKFIGILAEINYAAGIPIEVCSFKLPVTSNQTNCFFEPEELQKLHP